MSLIYCLIAKDNHILCHYSKDLSKGYERICKQILSKIQKQPQGSINYDQKYTINFIITYNLVFMCLADAAYPIESAFAYLREIMTEFLQQFSNDDIRVAYSFSFNKQFENVFKRIINYYNINLDSKANSNLKRLTDKLNETKSQLIETTAVLEERGETWKTVEKKAGTLKEGGQTFFFNAKKVKKKVEGKPKKFILITLTFVLGYILAIILCGGVALPNCFVTE